MEKDCISSEDLVDPESMEQGIVILDIGGTTFKTTTSTLINSPFFENFLKRRWRPDNNVLFIDKDPKIFYYVLEYMRGDLEMSSLKRSLHDRVAKQLDFFMLDYEEPVIPEVKKRSPLYIIDRINTINLNMASSIKTIESSRGNSEYISFNQKIIGFRVIADNNGNTIKKFHFAIRLQCRDIITPLIEYSYRLPTSNILEFSISISCQDDYMIRFDMYGRYKPELHIHMISNQ